MLQVHHDHYDPRRYDSPERFYSYGCQIQAILETKPKHVLEIGIGNGFVSRYLRDCGVRVTMFDLDAKLKPSVCGSVTDLPFAHSSFDTVSCCEVLEHLPFDIVHQVLRELARVSTKHVVISVPDVTPYFKWDYQWLPIIGSGGKLYSLPFYPFRPKHVFNGEHWWELGKQGYSLSEFLRTIRQSDLTPYRWQRVVGHPYHRLFMARKMAASRGRS